MQAQGAKRFPLGHISGGALAIIMLVGALLVAAVLNTTGNIPDVFEDDAVQVVPAPAASINQPADRGIRREGHSPASVIQDPRAYYNPVAGEGLVGSSNSLSMQAPVDAAGLRFVEENMYLGAGAISLAAPADQLQFLEDNLYLPGAGADLPGASGARPGVGVTQY